MKFTFLIALSFALPALASSHHTPPKIPAEFERVKKLIGTWEGTTKREGKEVPVTVKYTLTSGGTAVEEKLNEGTAEEMVSMYHTNGNKIAMTHYCSVGNQPEMTLKKSTDQMLVFEMVGNKGITSPKEMHMHAVTLTLTDPDQLKQEWTNYIDGKKGETVVLTFTRKKI